MIQKITLTGHSYVALQYSWCIPSWLVHRSEESNMSRQLAIAAAFSTLALTALALFAPGSARLSDLGKEKGATVEFAAPRISLPLVD